MFKRACLGFELFSQTTMNVPPGHTLATHPGYKPVLSIDTDKANCDLEKSIYDDDYSTTDLDSPDDSRPPSPISGSKPTLPMIFEGDEKLIKAFNKHYLQAIFGPDIISTRDLIAPKSKNSIYNDSMYTHSNSDISSDVTVKPARNPALTKDGPLDSGCAPLTETTFADAASGGSSPATEEEYDASISDESVKSDLDFINGKGKHLSSSSSRRDAADASRPPSNKITKQLSPHTPTSEDSPISSATPNIPPHSAFNIKRKRVGSGMRRLASPTETYPSNPQDSYRGSTTLSSQEVSSSESSCASSSTSPTVSEQLKDLTLVNGVVSRAHLFPMVPLPLTIDHSHQKIPCTNHTDPCSLNRSITSAPSRVLKLSTTLLQTSRARSMKASWYPIPITRVFGGPRTCGAPTALAKHAASATSLAAP